MKDYLNNPLEVGDKVVYMELNYRSLRTGTIHSFTPKMVRIACDEAMSWQKKLCLQSPCQIIKINLPQPAPDQLVVDRIIYTYSGDRYLVPKHKLHEIKVYQEACERLDLPHNNEVLLYFEEGHTGWKYLPD